MGKNAYLVNPRVCQNSPLFIRAISRGNNDDPSSFPESPHQTIYINGVESSVNDLFINLGTDYQDSVSFARGYLATFLSPNQSGWEIKESWKYDTFPDTDNSGALTASGFLSKLQSQPPNTLLVLSTRDEPYTNSSIFTGELINNWGATDITGLGYRGAYTLVSSKKGKKIYEEVNNQTGTGGFVGWINNGYKNNMWYREYNGYFSSTTETTGYAKDSVDWGSFGTGTTVQGQGFFKTNQSGDYEFRLASDDAGFLWLGPEAISGYTTGNAVIALPGFHGTETGYYTGTLEKNTYYPFRLLYGNAAGGGVSRLHTKYTTGSWTSIGPYHYNNYMKTLESNTYDIKFKDLYYQDMQVLYSLYDLRGTNENVVIARRKIDNTTRGFTAEEIQNGTLENWSLNEYVSGSSAAKGEYEEENENSWTGTNILSLSTITDSTEGSFALRGEISASTVSYMYYMMPFESGETYEYSFYARNLGGTGGYLLSRINALQVGVKISTPSDISFSLNGSWQLFTGSFTTNNTGDRFSLDYVQVPSDINYLDIDAFSVTKQGGSASEAYVRTWYDQSDNGNHAVMVATGYQPYIVTGGNMVVDESGNYSVLFDDNKYLQTSVIPPSTCTFVGIFDSAAAGGSSLVAVGGRDSTNERSYIIDANGLGRWDVGVADIYPIGSITEPSATILSAVYNGSNIYLYVDGVESINTGQSQSVDNTTYGYYLGALNNAGTASNFWRGKITHLSIFNTDKLTVREYAENKLRQVYTI